MRNEVSLAFTKAVQQGRNEVRWCLGQEASLVSQCLNLRSFGSKCTVLKKVLVTLLGHFGALIVIRCPVNYAPFPPRYVPAGQ